MIDIKEATRLATNYLTNLYGTFPTTATDFQPVRLEEVEITEDGKYWLITLSYPRPGQSLFSVTKRDYKIFKINAETGEFKSMKMREVA